MNFINFAKTISKAAKHGTAKSASFEITKHCNLQCKHCYRRDFSGQDLSDKKWLQIFKRLSDEGYAQAGWVGGEPLLRKNLIAKGKEYFHINAVITNGTIPLPRWPDTLFGVSVDGTEEIYKKIRGEYLNNQYQIVKQNIKKGIENGNHVFVLMTIHQINQAIIEEFVDYWHNENVSGVVLDFYTPQADEKKETIWLDWEKRDEVIDRIVKLRNKYGTFLPWNDPATLNKMRSKNCKKYTDQCRQLNTSPSKNRLKLNYKGNRLYPCIMGMENPNESKIDCDRCGCIFAFPLSWQAKLTSIKTAF